MRKKEGGMRVEEKGRTSEVQKWNNFAEEISERTKERKVGQLGKRGRR
jgi:hypothetical protein